MRGSKNVVFLANKSLQYSDLLAKNTTFLLPLI